MPRSVWKTWFSVTLILSLIIVGAISYLGWRQSVPGVRVDYVVGNDRNGAMVAVSHLIGLGHRRIAHLSAGQLAEHKRITEMLAG